MRSGPQAVARVFGKRVTPLLVLLAVLALLGDPRGGGVQAGLILASTVAFSVIVGGVAQAVRAFTPAVLRHAGAWGVALGIGAGVFAATGAVFDFIVVEIGGRLISVGGLLLHFAVFLAVASVGALAFLCLAARATSADETR